MPPTGTGTGVSPEKKKNIRINKTKKTKYSIPWYIGPFALKSTSVGVQDGWHFHSQVSQAVGGSSQEDSANFEHLFSVCPVLPAWAAWGAPQTQTWWWRARNTVSCPTPHLLNL